MSKKIPAVPLTKLAQFAANPVQFMVDAYHEYGAVFQVKLPGRPLIVLAGMDANRFMIEKGESYLGSEKLFGGFAKDMNAANFLTALDGPPHRRMRKLLRAGYARSAIEPQLQTMVDVAVDSLCSWKAGEKISVLDWSRRMVVKQLSDTLAYHRLSDEEYEAVRIYLYHLMNVHAMKMWPHLMLSRPKYKKAREQVRELGREILAGDNHSRLVADALATDFLDEDDLLAIAVGPFFAGMDTVASTFAFIVYSYLAHPEIHAAVKADAAALLADVTANAVPKNSPAKYPHLHGLVLEAMRIYPATPFTPRIALSDFEYDGFAIPKGKEVWIANTVTHMLPEHFPEPEKFDIGRYEKGRDQHKSSAFAPYSLGAHTCLGAGIAELQLLLDTAVVVDRTDLDLAGYRLKLGVVPLPHPRGFNVVVRGVNG